MGGISGLVRSLLNSFSTPAVVLDGYAMALPSPVSGVSTATEADLSWLLPRQPYHTMLGLSHSPLAPSSLQNQYHETLHIAKFCCQLETQPLCAGSEILLSC